MEASAGDRLIVESNRVGGSRKAGEVVEVLGTGRALHYRVRWDDGQETTFFPSSDATVQRAPAVTATSLPAGPARTATRVDLRFEEDDDHCEAWATLHTNIGTFAGHGVSRRNPVDSGIPLVREELAAARALLQLADVLHDSAGEVMAAGATDRAHLV